LRVLCLVWRILEGVAGPPSDSVAGHFRFILAAAYLDSGGAPLRALVLAPEGELVEQMASDPVRRAFGQASGGPAPETLLKDVIDSFRRQGRLAHQLIVLELGNLGPSGLSKLQEIGTALRDFRAGASAWSWRPIRWIKAILSGFAGGRGILDPLGLVYVDGFSLLP